MRGHPQAARRQAGPDASRTNLATVSLGLHSRWRPIRILPGHHLEATHLYIGVARARGGHQPHQDGADLPLGHFGAKPAHGARCEAEW